MRKFLKWNISLLLAASLLSGCKGSLSGSSNINSDNGKNSIPTEALENTTAKISQGVYKGVEVVTIDVAAKELVMTLPLPLPFGRAKQGYFDSNELDGSRWELKQDENNRWIAEIRIPLNKLVKGKFSDYPPSKLPNGEDLPGIVGGELPGFGLKWEDGNKELFLYLGAGAAAIFIPSYEFDPYIGGTVDIKSDSGERVGVFAIVPQNEVYYGGFYLAVKLPAKTAIWIDNNLY